MISGTLKHFEVSFGRVGWFIPPYMQMGKLSKVVAEIDAAGNTFTQSDLQKLLEHFYEPFGLAAMVLHRYPIAPIIQDYKITIREAVEAHFSGLDHIATGGLISVIEGAGRRIAAERKLTTTGVKDVFKALAEDCKSESISKGIGLSGEIVSMMDSFSDFTSNFLFAPSTSYSLTDGTNRHGIAHGAYADADYGNPINFYKIIAAVDFLTFIVSFRHNISWMAPDISEKSMILTAHYHKLRQTRTKSQFYN